MFAPAGLVREVARRSPRIQRLPVATQRQIARSYGAGAATMATSLTTGAGPDVAAGNYVVSGTPNGAGAPLYSAASNASAPVDTIPEGGTVAATGENDNFFARVSPAGAASVTGWISVLYLTPTLPAGVLVAGALALTFAEKLQLRTMLAAWSHATPGAPVYGVVSDDFAQTALADGRQATEVAAFQKWRGGLRQDGVVDDATRAAITAWAQGALANTPPGAVPGAANPPTPPAGQGNEPPAGYVTPNPPSSGAGWALAAAAALLALLLLEQKKKGKK